MTEVGLIARADNRGLGQQTWGFYRHMRPAKTLVIDCPSKQPLKLHLDRFPDAKTVKAITPAIVEDFCDGLDVIWTAETGYSKNLWREADKAGVATVLHANYEFWEPTDTPTKLVAASIWHLGDYPPGTQYLPVPIETDRFPEREPAKTAKRFLHVVGRPAIHDRNGTLDLLLALQHVETPIEVTITCQQPGYVGSLINTHSIRIPSRVTMRVESVDALHYWTKYEHQDALILPRRFGGLCLPAQEAIGAALPVVMPNIEPNGWLHPDWLVKATKAGDFQAKQPVTYYRTDPQLLAQVMDRLATDEHFYADSVAYALRQRDALSWNNQTTAYELCLTSASSRI